MRIPLKMQGSYLFSKDSGKIDTLIITANSFNFKDSVKHPLAISDSLILKVYKRHYFVNMQADDSVKTWSLYVLKAEEEWGLYFNGHG